MLSTFLRKFWTDERGNFAMIFGLSVVPVVALAGTATDYSVVSGRHTQLQTVLDAATLSGARNPDLKGDALKAYVRNFIAGHLGSEESSHWSLTSVTETAGVVTARATANVATNFVRLVGVNNVTIAMETDVKREDATYEIALVLDNSSSMADAFGGKSKVDAAKAAAVALVDTIFDSPGMSNKVKISVLPYTSAVNVGSEYKTAAWVDTNGQSSIHWQNTTQPAGATSRFTLFDWLGEAWGGCFETRPNGLGLTDDTPTTGNPDSLFVPMFAPDEPGNKLATSYSGNTVLNSYVNDDGQGACSGTLPSEWAGRQKLGCKYNINQNSSKVSYTTQWGIKTGPNFMCNAVKLLRLTTDRTTIKNKIGELKALGDTSIFEGIAWGWRTIMPNAPFADGRPYTGNTPENKKVLILLSDGNNNWLQLSNPNKSLYAPMGFYINNRLATGISTQTAANDMLNTKTKQVCTNAKNKGVLIYTVGIMLPGTPLPASWSDLITNCASTVDGNVQSFIATNGDQLVAVFKEIASRVTRLRITR
jgi:Flp pilus assembly protein TadG